MRFGRVRAASEYGAAPRRSVSARLPLSWTWIMPPCVVRGSILAFRTANPRCGRRCAVCCNFVLAFFCTTMRCGATTHCCMSIGCFLVTMRRCATTCHCDQPTLFYSVILLGRRYKEDIDVHFFRNDSSSRRQCTVSLSSGRSAVNAGRVLMAQAMSDKWTIVRLANVDSVLCQSLRQDRTYLLHPSQVLTIHHIDLNFAFQLEAFAFLIASQSLEN